MATASRNRSKLLLIALLAAVAAVLLLASANSVGAQSPPSPGVAKEDSKIQWGIRKFLHASKDDRDKRSAPGNAEAGSTSGLFRIDKDGDVQLYIVTENTADDSLSALRELGVRMEIVNDESGVIQAWAPPGNVEAIARLDFVRRIRAPDYAIANAGQATSEGDAILNADDVRKLGFTGRGIRVGVLSTGVPSRGSAQASGDLPANIELNPALSTGTHDEGTAMLEIVHDLAPDAELAFTGASAGVDLPTSQEVIRGYDWLSTQAFGGRGVDIIADDMLYLGQPHFEDGSVAQAAQRAVNRGAVVVRAAGNFKNGSVAHYTASYVSGNQNGLHDFDPRPGTTHLGMTVSISGRGLFILQWSDQYGASANDYDLFLCPVAAGEPVLDADGSLDTSTCHASSRDVQNGDDDPREVIVYTHPGSYSLIIIGQNNPQLRQLKLFTQNVTLEQRYHTVAGTVVGAAALRDVIAVTRIHASDPGHDTIASGHAAGPAEIYYPQRETRPKPDLTAIDGVTVSGAGGYGNPISGSSKRLFFGSSAAAPHVAGVAALTLQGIYSEEPGITKIRARRQAFDALMASAVDLGLEGHDSIYGHGRVDALRAIRNVLPPRDYDGDDDGLIEVSSLLQLNAIRYDLDGDGAVASGDQSAYDAAFAIAAAGMGCGLVGDHDGNANTADQAHCTGYELTDNLTFDTNGDGTVDASDPDTYENWAPIGGWVSPFNAIFDGGGHTIAKMNIETGVGNAGLFGSTGEDAIIRNLGVVNAEVDSPVVVSVFRWKLDSAAAVVGSNRGVIDRVYATGSVWAFDRVGGLAGHNFGSISNSYSAVSVTGSQYVGGLAGTNDGSGARITNSYNSGAVAGHNVRWSDGRGSQGSSVPFALGGLVGSIQNGATNASASASYWDTTASGERFSAGGTGKTTAELQAPTGATGIYSTWDPAIWDFGTSSEYPVVKYDTDGNGDATAYEFGVQGRSAPLTPVASNSAPTFISNPDLSPSVDEGFTGIVVTLRATDPDGDAVTYRIVPSSDDAASLDAEDFQIGGGSVAFRTSPNYERPRDSDADNVYVVKVQVRDSKAADGTPDTAWDAIVTVTVTVADVNELPVFVTGVRAQTAPENQQVVKPAAAAALDTAGWAAWVAATDVDADDRTLTYGIVPVDASDAATADATKFTIDDSTGKLTFIDAPDFEAPGSALSSNTYKVKIQVRDSRNAAGTTDTDWDDAITLTVNVTDADEPPGAPTGVEVTSTANGLDVTWTAPVMTGKPPLTGYDVESRLRSSAADAPTEVWGDWTDASHSGTTASASLDELTPGATYQVRVRGVNAEGDGEWAGPENGVPGQPNRAPAFPSDSVTLEVDENTAPGADIDDSPTATDPDGDSLVYTLGGTDSGHFAIVAGSGQLQTKGALNHENQDSYSVVVTASDGTLADTIAVTINVNDLNEAPSFDGSGVTLEVDENTAPATAFDSPVTATDPDGDTLEYSLAGTDSGHFAIVAGSGQLKTKGALDHENQDSYAVTVTAEDPSGLSADIAVTINVTDVNEPPSFADSAKTLDVAENTAPATAIGNPIAAIDPEGDLLTYTIDGADASHFDIVARTGQLKTNGVLNLPTRKAAPDGTTTDSYSVVVSVSDGKDANGDADDTLDDTIDVTVRVRGVRQASAMVDYDIDDDGLIELANLARLNAIRWDLNGDGAVDNSADQPSHDAAFPNAMPGMGCPDTDGDAATPNCTGYELTENLDFDTDGSGDANSADTYWNGGQGWEPIASGANPFTAPLEGNGHTISNLFIHRTTAGGQLGEHEVGLFAHIGQINDLTAMEIDNGHNAVIRRLGLINVSVTGGGGATGALLGHNAGGKIIACYSTGSVSGGPGLAGGLVGLNNMAGLVKDSYSSADVRALHYAGGLVGDNHRGGYILTSYATGDVKANNAGGLTSGNRGHIKNTYATGDVQARLAGGLVGRNFWKIWNSYSTGAVTGVSRGPIMIGGLVGYGRTYTDPTRTLSVTPTVHDSYWDTAASGQNTSGWGGQGGAGKTAAELQTPTTFTGIYENWDDYHYLLDRGDSAMAWDLGDSSEYPALKADWDGDGEATVAEFGSQVRSARIARRSVGAEPVHQPPANLQVELQSDGSALVSWDTPDGAGGDASYSVRRRADAPNSEYVVVRVEDGDDDGAAEYLDQDSLEPGQSYLYSVRAFDGYGEPLGQWTDDVSVSIPAASPTSAANNPPSFPAASATVEVAENTASGTDIGDALTTTDPDADDKLTYTLDGKDSGHFAIDAGSGQLKTSGALDYESKDSYAVTVTATDGGGLSASIDVTITVTDVADTPPGQPDTPEIINVAETSFRVTWAAPAAGSSAITGYGIQYKLASEEDSAYADVNPTPTGTATGYNVVNRGGQTVAAGTSYAVRVRARNAEGWGLWSDAASVVTAGAPPANNPPSFAAASATVEVAENSAADTAIANSPTATDPDVGDTLTYTLGTTMDDGHFAIDTGSGQLRTKGDLDYESKDSYAVTVTATDGGGLSASVEVTITVTDVADTPPGQPATPEIINVEETSFRVTWTVPADGSSTITGYGIQYKLASEEDSAYADVNPTPTGTATGYNLVNGGGQTVAEGTSYAVRVRAKNAEGWGTWSDAASAVTAGAAPSDAAPANGDEAEADDSGDEEPADGDDSYQATAHFITNQGRVLVKWDEVDGAAYYLIGKNGQPMPGRTDTTTLYDADVEEGTRYEYRITAYDGEDNELAVMTAATDE